MKLGRVCGLASPTARAARIQMFVLGLFTLLSLNALAFNSSLQPEEVQEAYSLGQTTNHEELANFLNQYEHDFKYPSDNSVAFVSSVEFQTPYEQIVLRSLRTAQYTKFQADEDYQANPGLVIVRVMVSLKTGYSGPAPPADSFKVVVSQTKPIEPRKVTSTVLCDPYNPLENTTFANCIAYTREILQQFDAAQFAPGRATVQVDLPFGLKTETKYNLDKLK
jgi:hypothetical protein